MTAPATRRLRHRAAFALIAFVATTLVALFAPLAQGHAYEEVCSAQGVKFVVVAGDADTGHRSSPPADHAAHCPLCMPVGAPPADMAWDFTPVLTRTPEQVGVSTDRVARLVGASLPARGPPSLS